MATSQKAAWWGLMWTPCCGGLRQLLLSSSVLERAPAVLWTVAFRREQLSYALQLGGQLVARRDRALNRRLTLGAARRGPLTQSVTFWLSVNNGAETLFC